MCSEYGDQGKPGTVEVTLIIAMSCEFTDRSRTLKVDLTGTLVHCKTCAALTPSKCRDIGPLNFSVHCGLCWPETDKSFDLGQKAFPSFLKCL